MKHAPNEILLDGTWELRDEDLDCGAEDAPRILKLKRGWIPTPVPGDVRQGLIAAGTIEDPLLGLNSLKQHWVEERSWWLRKQFSVTSTELESDQIELEIDGLDVHASIFLNGSHLGDHPSAFRPFVTRIEEHLVKGENTLLIRLTSGTETVPEEEADALGGFIQTSASRPERGDRRRVFLRKPQYTWGWDWAPRIASVAIAGSVRLRVLNKTAIRDVAIVCERRGERVEMQATVTVEWLDWYQEGRGTVELSVTDPDGRTVQERSAKTFLQSGLNYVELRLPIRNPKLWWPAGMGRQDLYTVSASVRAAGRTLRHPPIKYGIRFVELERDNTFAISVNGVRTFCKGANWITPDALYARATDEQISHLVAEAKLANFNMFRVNGVGRYERDSFYEACDCEGIMVWQDFMFGCAPYPDHLESFRDEVAREADFQTRRLRNHACVVLWCGSNENLNTMRTAKFGETERGSALMGRVLPAVVRQNCPGTPYWYCSPYGGRKARYESFGNCHYWEHMMHGKMTPRITPERYDRCRAHFVTEFGYIGPCDSRTTSTYLDGAPFDLDSEVWLHHTNTFEKDTVSAGIRKHYADPEGLTPEEYFLYGGLTHGMMLGYALDALRAKERCHGGLFWMYDDCWGEVGWPIIDYCRRRKIPWYFVRRALSHRRLIMRARGDQISVKLANDTLSTASGVVEYGYVSLDGKCRDARRVRFTAPPAARTVVATFTKGKHAPTHGLWYARANARDILTATLKATDFRRLKTAPPNLSLRITPAGTNGYRLRIATDVHAHAVQIALPDEAVPEDNYFDLLPGESRTINVRSPRCALNASNVSLTSCYVPGLASPG